MWHDNSDRQHPCKPHNGNDPNARPRREPGIYAAIRSACCRGRRDDRRRRYGTTDVRDRGTSPSHRPRSRSDLATPRTPLLPGVAGHQGPLQADGDRRGLGRAQSAADGAHLRGGVRKAGQDPLRRSAIHRLRVRRLPPVDLFRAGVQPEQCQPGRQCPSDHEGLFPPADDSAVGRHDASGGCLPVAAQPVRAHALVSGHPDLGAAPAARVSPAGGDDRPRHGAVAGADQRQVPRRESHDPIPRAGVDVLFAGRVPADAGPRAVAAGLQPESHGRGHRGLSLVAPGDGHARRARHRSERGGGARRARRWPRLLPADGTRRRGRRLMGDVAIRVENISKAYKITAAKYRHDTLRDQLMDGAKSLLHPRTRRRSSRDVFWALREVSFEVKRGEVVGIVGHNGAGKSTLLKILSRITEPSAGRAEIYGRVGSLLEVGTGFDHELTGLENIYLSGAILGMKKAEIDRKLDEIIAFSEVEKFIDTPVKRYSSGMYVRLAFAVAAHLEPEILVVDEVLSVGDVEFQKKCLGKLKTIGSAGRTVLYVSHNLASIEALCTHCVLLASGKISGIG